MKKTLFFLFSLSLLLFAAGCDENEQDDSIVFPDPDTKDVAVIIDFNKGDVLHLELPNRPTNGTTVDNGDLVTVTIPEIDLSEGKRYILYIEDTKAGTPTVWTGRFTFDRSSNIYNLEGFGSIQTKDGLCIISPIKTKAGDPIQLPATITPIKTADRPLSNISRTWKVTSTYVKAKGGKNNVKFSRGFDGCDLHEIAQFCKKEGVSLTDDDIAQLVGFKITEMMLLGNKHIVIGFQSAGSYNGTYALNSSAFSWSLNTRNKLIPNTTQGTVSFLKNQTVELYINTTITSGGESYDASMLFTLSEVK